MQVTFLGTAAAEGIPAVWCECETCKKAITAGGREIRRRCTYLVDDDTMIDFGPDAYRQLVDCGIDWTKLKRVVFTHDHPDHLCPQEFICRRTPWFSQLERELTVVGSRRIFSRILAAAVEGGIYKLEDLQIRPVEISDGETITERDIAITALKADHSSSPEPQVFILERNGRRFFVANDTGFLPEESWTLLKGVKLDLVVIDCTMRIAYADNLRGHLGVNGVVKFRDRLAELGCLEGTARVFANHFSHNGGNLHADLEAFFAPHGIEVAYDGLQIRI